MKNRNPLAIRDNRQTYIGRNYRGKVGKFLDEQKILIRYNENDLLDMDIIADINNKIDEIARSHARYDNDVLEYGKTVIEEALRKYTPIDTGNLVDNWVVEVNYEEGRIDITNSSEYATNQEYGTYQPDRLGRKIFYPGYYMATKSIHEGEIAMREYARMKQEELRSRVENG